MNLKKIDDLATARDNLICLQYTQKLDADALRHPKWIEIKSLYVEGKGKNKMTKAVVSIANGILCHDRIVFCITRDTLFDLIRNDKNQKNTISNDDFKDLLRILFQGGTIRLIQKAKGKPWIVEVIDPDLLKFMKKQTREEQLSECINFVNREPVVKSDGHSDALLDGHSDGVRSTQQIVNKNEVTEKEVKTKIIYSDANATRKKVGSWVEEQMIEACKKLPPGNKTV